MSIEMDRRAEVARALEEADELRRQGKHEEGIKLLTNALSWGADQAQIFYRLGNLYFDAKKYDHAEYSYRRAIDHEADHINAHYNLGVTYKKMGRIDESMKLRKKANKLAQQHPERVKVSTDQVTQIRSFAKKLLFIGMGFVLLLFVIILIFLR
ncbi:tetratricopeptide repeat protein [Candidatus Acetothermia bacterium]|nr:tetratricopeptide repeat protein [Candidatus Acetothermia bacterium]MBI3644245.1 tetratricopeptide repeat protein [Candidatus Acetothermia bacterium]